MDSLTTTNGSASASDARLTPAEQLKARHSANASGDHHVLVEDVVDEDDIAHPPPPVHSQPGPSNMDSDTAAGASDTSRGKFRPAPLNVDSEEAFPTLGPAKPAPSWPAQSWSRIPGPSSTGPVSGAANGISSAAKGKGPRLPAQATAPAGSNVSLPGVSLPGRLVERITFAPHQITPKSQLKKPISDILRDLNKKSKARVEMREGANGNLIFEGSGPQDAVRLALKEVATQIGSKVCSLSPPR
jgi:hypothetical protein